MFALQTGWIILLASTPQAVYDMNLIAVKLGEHPDVRLPVMVVSDGFFTSHQRQSCQIFKDSALVQSFLGIRSDPNHALDPRRPVTIGPYMNDSDLINNKWQLHLAHERATNVYAEIAADFENLSGRAYPAVESYRHEGATSSIFLLNSAAETAKDAIDSAWNHGNRVSLLRPNILRPFPAREVQELTHSIGALVIAERSDTPGSAGGPLSHEVRSAVLADKHAELQTYIRVFGLGGRDFSKCDAEELIRIATGELQTGHTPPSFAFMGTKSALTASPIARSAVLEAAETNGWSSGLVQVERVNDPASKTKLRVLSADVSKFSTRRKRIAPGHGACPGCGIFSGLDQFFKGLEGDVVVLYHTGCAMVVTTDYPFSAHRISYIHNLFQNGAPTLAGLLETFHERKRRGELPSSEDITFVMITGDGGMDIGMGPTIGTALRNHRMIILEYDNQGYMNTGGQLSYSTPLGKVTATSHKGRETPGKPFHHKNTVEIMAATGVPYLFTAVESTSTDLIEKAAKAQWYARNRGLAFGKILVSCPLNWKAEERAGSSILRLAVDSCFFPLYEIQEGLTSLTRDPTAEGTKVPLARWLETMGSYRHLLKAENKMFLYQLQGEVDRRWERLRAMAAHPLL